MGRIVPIYEKIGSLTPKLHRRVVYQTLQALNDTLEDPLPPEIQERLGYPSKIRALTEVHFPQPGTGLEALNEFRTMAQERLIFEEFFFFQRRIFLPV